MAIYVKHSSGLIKVADGPKKELERECGCMAFASSLFGNGDGFSYDDKDNPILTMKKFQAMDEEKLRNAFAVGCAICGKRCM